MMELNNFFKDFATKCDKCNSTICTCMNENPIGNWINKFHLGDSFELANLLPDESIDCITTSPPYFKLRIYSDDSNEIGREENPYDYINKLVNLFSILKRKLKDTGTLFVNLGDVYAGGCGGPQSWEREADDIQWHEQSKKNPHRRDKMIHKWMKPKQLLLVPPRFAIEMQNAGWVLRNCIIWNKPNSAPMSIKDRFKNSFEYIFFFTKNKRYFFNIDDIRIPHKTPLNSLQNRINYDTERRGGKLQEGQIGTGIWSTHERNINPLGTIPQDFSKYEDNFPKNPNGRKRLDTLSTEEKMHPLGASPGDVLEINTQPSTVPHYAQFPETLIKPLIIAGTPKEVCLKCKTPKEKLFSTRINDFIITKCKCDAGFGKGIVLDPFMGAGTVALVAEKLGFDWIGFELVHKNIEYSMQRMNDYHESLKFNNIDDFKEIQKLKKDAEKTKHLMEFYNDN